MPRKNPVHDPKTKIVGQNIKKYRESKGMTQAGLARAAAVSRDAILRYERAERMPSVQTLCALAEVLEVSESTLLRENNNIWIGSPLINSDESEEEIRNSEIPEGNVQLFSLEPELLKNQKRILEWEKTCEIKCLIQPPISDIHLIDPVVTSLQARKYQIQYQEYLSQAQIDRLLQGINARRELLYKEKGYHSFEIAYKSELMRFTEGKSPYDGISKHNRLAQYKHFLNNILLKCPKHIHFGVIENFSPVECLILDEKRFVIQGLWDYIVILGEAAAKKYVDDFFKIWNIAQRGTSVYDFIRQEIRKLEKDLE